MKFRHDMSKETNPMQQFPEGWHEYIITDCNEQISKQGNEMFKITLQVAKDPTITGDIYAIATRGKRWFLKQILTACEVPAGKDGIYEWDTNDVINKHILANGVAQQEEWLDREGNKRVSTKVKIVGVRSLQEEIPF